MIQVVLEGRIERFRFYYTLLHPLFMGYTYAEFGNSDICEHNHRETAQSLLSKHHTRAPTVNCNLPKALELKD